MTYPGQTERINGNISRSIIIIIKVGRQEKELVCHQQYRTSKVENKKSAAQNISQHQHL